eukprot:30769-Pelagococcus_subviridis.AAC.13
MTKFQIDPRSDGAWAHNNLVRLRDTCEGCSIRRGRSPPPNPPRDSDACTRTLASSSTTPAPPAAALPRDALANPPRRIDRARARPFDTRPTKFKREKKKTNAARRGPRDAAAGDLLLRAPSPRVVAHRRADHRAEAPVARARHRVRERGARHRAVRRRLLRGRVAALRIHGLAQLPQLRAVDSVVAPARDARGTDVLDESRRDRAARVESKVLREALGDRVRDAEFRRKCREEHGRASREPSVDQHAAVDARSLRGMHAIRTEATAEVFHLSHVPGLAVGVEQKVAVSSGR